MTQTVEAQISPPSDGLAIENIEQCTCLCCESVIRQEHIFRNIPDLHTHGPTIQILRAWCDHCGRLYRVDRVLRNGDWHAHGSVKVVTDEREIKAIRLRIEKQNGDRQVKSA